MTRSKLYDIILSLKVVRNSKKFMPTKLAIDIKTCSMQNLLLKIHKILRYFFIACYYYITPFLILVFQIFLLYGGIVYGKFKLKLYVLAGAEVDDGSAILDLNDPSDATSLLL